MTRASEAAERLRQHSAATGPNETPYDLESDSDWHQMNVDIEVTSYAYLRLTDPTPIDEDWLRSCKFIEDDEGWHYGGIHLMRLLVDWRCQIGGTSGVWEHMQNQGRGSVRALCLGLGIELKEPTE